MVEKGKRKDAVQPASSTQAAKRHKLAVKRPSAAPALQNTKKSKTACSALRKSPKRPSKAKPSDSHIKIAVAKAVDDSKHLKECKGEARKDLYSSIVDLLTEALVKDVDNVKSEGTTGEVSLSARDEPLPAGEQLPSEAKTQGSHSKERPKNKSAGEKQSEQRKEVVAQQGDGSRIRSKRRKVESEIKNTQREKEHRASKSPKKASNGNVVTTLKRDKPEPPPQTPSQTSPHASKSKKGLAKRATPKSPAAKSSRPKKETPKETREFVEECIVDEGTAAMPNPEPRASSGKKRKRAQRPTKGYHTEVVLDSSEHDVNPDQKSMDLILNARSRLPWWRATESLVSLPSKPQNLEDLLKFYVMAVIRSCVRESWSAEKLKHCFDKDPTSSRGKAFLAISSSLLLMERARHMGQCHVKWRPELIQELVQRRIIEWSKVPKHVSFDHFAGCDVCLGQREATIRLWLRGDRYDSSDFWPGSSRVDVLSSEERLDQDIMSVAVELVGSTKNERFIAIGEAKDRVDAEFWVDPQCLRKCLLFHELVHATAIIAQDLRILIEDELRDGVVHLDMRNRVPGDEKLGVPERLERYLVQAVTENRDFLKRRTKHLMEIIRLGDIYFSSVEEELIDSGAPEGRRARKTPQMYDPPIDLNDEKYKDRIERIVSLTQQREINASFATFG